MLEVVAQIGPSTLPGSDAANKKKDTSPGLHRRPCRKRGCCSKSLWLCCRWRRSDPVLKQRQVTVK